MKRRRWRPPADIEFSVEVAAGVTDLEMAADRFERQRRARLTPAQKAAEARHWEDVDRKAAERGEGQ